MREPVDHVIRPTLPWRMTGVALTECGYDASKVKTISRDELIARLKDYGQQRTAILTCMTCVETATRWRTWDQDPRDALDREIQWERRRDLKDTERSLRAELSALAELADSHRDEFEEAVARHKGVETWQVAKAEFRRRKRSRAKL